MIIHISQNNAKYPNKFLPGLKDFVDHHVHGSQQHYYIYEGDSTGLNKKDPQHIFINQMFSGVAKYRIFYGLLKKANKIFIHGPFSKMLLLLFTLYPRFLKKTYWVMWGTDLYQQEKDKGSLGEVGLSNYVKNKLKARVIQRIGYLVTFLSGDVDIARSLYGATGVYRESFVYPSNLYNPLIVKNEEASSDLSIIIGNSAYPRNDHIQAFSLINESRKNIQKDIKVYAPLSYGGTDDYISKVIQSGSEFFGDNFVPITDFLSLAEYTALLGKINIAINASRRQQSLGNTITLLGAGAKVYMYKDVSQWEFFNCLGVRVYDLEQFDLSPIDNETIHRNIQIISSYFSVDTLKRQLSDLFDS